MGTAVDDMVPTLSREESLSPDADFLDEEYSPKGTKRATRPRSNSRKATAAAAAAAAAAAPAKGGRAADMRHEESEEARKSQISPKRAEQNRAAQRAFRERRIQYVKNLEDQLQEAAQRLKEAEALREQNSELQRLIAELARENERLKATLVVDGAPAPAANGARANGTFVNGAMSHRAPASDYAGEERGENDEYDDEEELELLSTDYSSAGIDDKVARHIYQSGYEPSPPSPAPYNLLKLKSEAQTIGIDDFIGKYVTNEGQIDLIKPLKGRQEPSLAAWGPTQLNAGLTPSALDDALLSPIGFRTSSTDMLESTSILEDDTVLGPFNESPPARVPSAPTTPCQTGDQFLVDLNTNTTANGVEASASDEYAHKRSRDDARIYTAPTTAFPARIFSKNEQAEKDKVETELCELMRAQSTLTNDTDPERCNKTKFLKKTTA